MFLVCFIEIYPDDNTDDLGEQMQAGLPSPIQSSIHWKYIYIYTCTTSPTLLGEFPIFDISFHGSKNIIYI